MKERLNTEIEKALPDALRQAVRQHPLKKLFQEEEMRIRAQAAEDGQKAPDIGKGSARVIPISRRLAAIAAVLLVVCFSGYFVWDKVFAEPPLYVSLIDLPEPAEKADQEPEAIFLKGIEAFFDDKDYEKAAGLFSQIEPSSDWYYQSQFLLAHSYHCIGNFKEAIRIYNYFLTNNEAHINLPKKFRDKPLRWNLALAYWGDKNKAKAKQELDRFKQEIGNDPSWEDKIKTFETALMKK